ncbi:MAG TPA: rhodanese-like domain-containing protein [Chitinophagaceae bacterium]|nr:rhodanese-like domain-containing protein [Chitinophagaceae bacterium]HNE92483.1 rhodanese-like domain-containing protein [Chitinophagaceae bacterium]HNL81869.1 rhodanese-like domain-containing protein [Chitinophagaceae bacterium]HNM34216.1 rhodanese-like domain-containing protein [Chitinophagaceae bacterium]HNN31155.1 rhodanese-like domain-containing protein [Chitinophagaceae bacterium]
MGIFSMLFGSANKNKIADLCKQGALLVDVRTPAEFSTGSVKGAINIPLNTIHNQTAKFKNKNNIIVFCKSGVRSAQAKSILEQSGITNVTNGGTWQSVHNAINN